MLIMENPLLMLFIALGILIFFLTLFKFLNMLESIKAKPSKKTAKAEPKKEEKPIEEKKEPAKDEEFDYKNITNYLYDRFVTNPSRDDEYIEKNISESFLNDKEYSDIRNKKVDIRVEPVVDSSKDMLYQKIQELTNNNRQEKEKLLDEFNGLSREMKLLLIENIMQKID